MAERKTIVPGYNVTYEGIFEFKKLYKIIVDWIDEHGYDRNEYKNMQIEGEKGKDVDIFWEPEKKVSDYAKIVLRIIFRVMDMENVDVKLDEKKINANKGKVNITLIGFLDTDYESKWESKPLLFFIRHFFDKVIYRSVLAKHEEQIISELQDLRARIKGFLNIERYET